MKDELRQQERHYQQVEFNLKNEVSCDLLLFLKRIVKTSGIILLLLSGIFLIHKSIFTKI